MDLVTFLVYSAGCIGLGISGTMLFSLDKFFPANRQKPVPDPNDQALRQQAVLLYYHDGAWEQAEVGEFYMAWDAEARTNVTVFIGRYPSRQYDEFHADG